MLVDTHCHLDFDSFEEDLEEVISRACQAGIGRILNPGIDIPSSRKAIHMAQTFPEVYAAVGVHPNSSMTWINGSKLELIELASSPKVVAIGEIGLDYYRDRAPRKMQQDVLREQLVVAHDFGLPVVLHTRDKPDGGNQVVEDILQILLAWEDELTGVFHSFSFDLETALKVIEIGFFIGITGPITFKKAETLRHLVANVPLDHILVETDAPFLTPHPYRGKRNEPGYVRYVAEEIARVRGMSYEEVSNQTTLNANKLFKWDAR